MANGSKRHPLATWRGPDRRFDLVAEGTIAVIVVAVLCVVAAISGAPGRGPDLPEGTPVAGPGLQCQILGREQPIRPGPDLSERVARRHDHSHLRPAIHADRAFPGVSRRRPREDRQIDLRAHPASQYGQRLCARAGLPDRRALQPVRSGRDAFVQGLGGDLTPGVPGSQIASAQQQTWLANYAKALALSSAKVTPTSITVRAGNYGPAPAIIQAELLIANNGSLDGYFQGSQLQLRTNTYQATMFFSDGTLWHNIPQAQGVSGSQWGVINEVWNYPGQVWLWLYAGLYQPPILNPSTNANLDLDVGLLMVLLGFLLPMFAPWIPGINRVPHSIRSTGSSTAGTTRPPRTGGRPPPQPAGRPRHHLRHSR